MAKMSKEELLKKISEKIEDENIQIELMEDITDSFEQSINSDYEQVKAELEKAKAERDEVKKKYKERFLAPASEKEKEKDPEEPTGETIIDVKEI